MGLTSNLLHHKSLIMRYIGLWRDAILVEADRWVAPCGFVASLVQPAMKALYPVRAYWIPIAITMRPM